MINWLFSINNTPDSKVLSPDVTSMVHYTPSSLYPYLKELTHFFSITTEETRMYSVLFIAQTQPAHYCVSLALVLEILYYVEPLLPIN